MTYKQQKNGWYQTVRYDNTTKRRRPIEIFFVNGIETKHHWLDYVKK